MKSRLVRVAGAMAAGVLSLVMAVTAGVAPASAATGSDFNPGRIMSDSVFYASTSMNVDQVQGFLNSKVSACRTGYTCLKDYRQSTGNIAADRYCSGYSGAAQENAATIIVKAAAACGISPKVLVVLLEKEQSLVTDTWPSATQYAKATGNGCPDTAPCDPAYLGFTYQVYYGAQAFQRYTMNAAAYRYRAGQTANIAYHPRTDINCGSAPIAIQNNATAALYNYTPYIPNAAAMSNLYGASSDPCASYGNRNFWRIYTDWFGSTISGLDNKDAISLIHSLYADILLRAPDEGGINTWRGYLIGQGWPTISVANGILYSDEYYLQRIDAAYREVLGREPDEVGRADWLNRMRTGQASVDAIRRSFTSSLEFYLKAGGTDEAFVNVLYSTLLGRTANPDESAYWAGEAKQRGGHYVVNAIWDSHESGTIRVNALYMTFLKRGVDAGGIASWVPLITTQGDQAVRTTIVSSMEYLLQSRTRFPQ